MLIKNMYKYILNTFFKVLFNEGLGCGKCWGSTTYSTLLASRHSLASLMAISIALRYFLACQLLYSIQYLPLQIHFGAKYTKTEVYFSSMVC